MPNPYQVVMVPINKLRPDPKQPRRHADRQDIEELATSIKKTGLLKNIEVTPKHVLVTGELRWRAARAAGLKEVPVRIVELSREEIYERQLHENIHVTPMNPYDIAEALQIMFATAVAAEEYQKIARETGKSPQWVRDHLRLLEMPKPIQQAISDGRVPVTAVRSIARVHELESEGDVKKGTTAILAKKIATGELTNRDSMDRVAHAIADNPGAAESYLKSSFKGKSETQVQQTLDKVSPTRDVQRTNYKLTADFIERGTKSLRKELERVSYSALGPLYGSAVLSSLQELKRTMTKWNKNLA